ncbi:MAG: RNA polymerase sigma factor [Saprospiraceae bacterium]|nr:RNA polymerase sigma factor [Saprospiraceae bacterium]
MTDLELIKACKKGDTSAQEALYHRFKAKLFGVCLRYAESYQEAEDFLQDGFIQIYKDLYQYQPFGSLEGWLRRVVVNVALQHIRKKKKWQKAGDLSNMEYKMESGHDIIADLSAKNLVKMVQGLPDGYRAVFNLYVIEGYSHQEIGELLGISSGTSKSQLSRAKAFLRDLLNKTVLT